MHGSGILALEPPVEFVIPGAPVPWARAGMRGRFRYTLAMQHGAAMDMRWLCKAAMRGRNPFEGPVSVELVASWPPPPSWSNKRRANTVWHASRPDIDNIAKIILDALRGVAYLDDAQVVRLLVEKLIGDTAQVVVRIALL